MRVGQVKALFWTHCMGEIFERHCESYLAEGLYLFDGNAFKSSHLRTSLYCELNLPLVREEGVDWEKAVLPNTIMRGVVKDERVSDPQPR